MIVLGLHGWNGAHDAAAALIVDGAVVGCVEEERLSRNKHAPSEKPLLAAHALLQRQGLTWDDVDVVAYGWDLPAYTASLRRSWSYRTDRDFLDAGKTMGLAAFAPEPVHPLPIDWGHDEIISPVSQGSREHEVVSAWSDILASQYGDPVTPGRCFDSLSGRLRWSRDGVEPHRP